MTTAQSVHADRQVSASVALTIFEPRRTSQKATVNNVVREVILLGGSEYARGAGSKWEECSHDEGHTSYYKVTIGVIYYAMKENEYESKKNC